MLGESLCNIVCIRRKTRIILRISCVFLSMSKISLLILLKSEVLKIQYKIQIIKLFHRLSYAQHVLRVLKM